MRHHSARASKSAYGMKHTNSMGPVMSVPNPMGTFEQRKRRVGRFVREKRN